MLFVEQFGDLDVNQASFVKCFRIINKEEDTDLSSVQLVLKSIVAMGSKPRMGRLVFSESDGSFLVLIVRWCYPFLYEGKEQFSSVSYG